MFVTEKEAAEKWCPFARFAKKGNAAGNDGARCVASDCMMWRWTAEAPPDGVQRGYCGLAGGPILGLPVEEIPHAGQRPPAASGIEEESAEGPEEASGNKAAAAADAPERSAFSEEDFDNMETFRLAEAVAEAGLGPVPFRGAIAIGHEPIALRGQPGDRTVHDDGTVVLSLGIEALVPSHKRDTLVPLRATVSGVGESRNEALRNAARHWIEGCMAPLRAAVSEDYAARADREWNLLTEDGVTESPYYAFHGPLEASGEAHRELADVFGGAPFDWLCARGEMRLRNKAFHLVKLFAARQPDGSISTDCTLDGIIWQTANHLLEYLPWPKARGYQSVRAFTVLRKV